MADLVALQPGAYTAVWLSFCVGTIIALLRFYCRLFIVRNWGWDDWFAVVIFLVFIPQQYVLQSWLELGCGRHWYDSCTYYSDYFFKVLFIEQVLIYFLHFLIKTSFCIFYLRLSPDRTFRRFVFLGMGFNGCVFITIVFIVFLQCTPFTKIIDPFAYATVGSCLDTIIPNVVPPVLTICVDLYVLVLPVRTIAGLQISNSRKAGILCIVCFGLASLSLSAVRFPFVLEMTDALASLSSTYDMSYNVAKMIILVALEMQFAFIALNLPGLTSLLKHHFKQIRTSAKESSGNSIEDQNTISLVALRKRKGSRGQNGVGLGTITRLERGMTSVDSEEELCGGENKPSERYYSNDKQGNKLSAPPMQDRNKIEVTTCVDVVSKYNPEPWARYPGH